jgi:hypothetical protein
MMRTPTKYLIVVGGLCLAYSLGTVHGNTELRTVKVPVTKTKVVTVTREAKTIKQLPLQQSCLDAISLTQTLAKSGSTIAKSSGALLDSLADVERDSVQRDVKSMNKNLTVIRQNRSLLGDAVISDSELRSRIQEKYNECQNEIESK